MSDPLQSLLKFRFYVLTASLTLIFIGSGSLYLIAVTMKDLAREFGWPREVPSLAFSLQFIGGGIGGIMMGWLLDRVGAKVLPLIAATAIATGSILTTVVTEKIELYGIYLLLFGFLGQGSLYAPLMANISKWYERRRGMVVGIVASGQSLSGIVWPPIFGYAITEVGWQYGFVGYGIIAAVVMLPMCLIMAKTPPSHETLQQAEALDGTDSKGRPRRGARKSEIPLTYKGLQIALCCAIVGCCISMSLPLAHLVAHASDKGLPLTDAVTVLSVTLMAAFVARCVIVGLLSDNIGGLWALFCFSALQAAMLFLLTVADSVWMLYVVGIGFGLGYGGIFPVYAVIIREYMPPQEAGRRTGVVFLFGALAMGFGSWMGGALFDSTGSYTTPFLIGVAANCVNLVIVGLLASRSRKSDDGAQPVPAAA
jgi:MFS family permease